MPASIIEKLKQKELNIESALQTLIDIKSGTINLELLDADVSSRFFRSLKNPSSFPPIIPLLLWQNCYYLGCPVKITKETYQILCQRLGTNIKIVPISEKSYSDWYRLQNLDRNCINGDNNINPLTGEVEQENITEIAELYLSRTDDQIERIKTIISSALRNRASDIHLEPTTEGLRIRYRIDGILRHVTTLPLDVSRKVIVSLKVMCEMDIGDSRRPQDGRIGEKYTTQQQQEQALDLRVSTLPCVSDKKGEPAEKAVLRLLRQQNTFQTIDDLGFTTHTRPIYESWLHQPQGMIILTGPTGSGKTSTLYTSLQAIATDSVNIVTVEDPVEYVLPGITQTQVCDAAGMTFAAGLRAILRQDPDVIMLGEIRDAETAETAVRAALTGHLVLTTLHTNDAVGAIPRLKDIGPDPGLVSDALLGVVAQRLVRRVCPHCAEPYTPTEADLKVLGLDWDEAQPQQWRRGKGCPKCFNSGYLGREAVIELLNVDETVRQIIYEGTMTQLHHHLNENRFESFRVAAINKVIAGLTTIEEVRRVLPQSALYKKPVSGQRMGQVAFLNAS
ncbi:GspE/PulE family protein [Calothrix sp. UHCC 0171]|uniref:GspE/PulE family protein n=1 Tax=Calothrix sp. UHCC 0171 TaxID=3110245 RepID=UPI002B1F985F|nr:GspE/PulE family protein [Calothrix sp. UHCC 0171]MEA5573015.1 GspE/PulE family protein [Calothrix sp. UHCC 0171]